MKKAYIKIALCLLAVLAAVGCSEKATGTEGGFEKSEIMGWLFNQKKETP